MEEKILKEELTDTLNELLDAVPKEGIICPFDAGVVSTVAILKKKFNIE